MQALTVENIKEAWWFHGCKGALANIRQCKAVSSGFSSVPRLISLLHLLLQFPHLQNKGFMCLICETL